MRSFLVSLFFLCHQFAWAYSCGVPPDRDPQMAYASPQSMRFAMENYYRCMESSENQQRLNNLQMQQNVYQSQTPQPVTIQQPPLFDIRGR